MDQREVIEVISKEVGVRPCRLLDRWGDGLGELKNTRQAYHQWIKGETKPNPKTLRHALTVFRPDSWEYRLADGLLRARGAVDDGQPG
jgi:hypothetical protein